MALESISLIITITGATFLLIGALNLFLYKRVSGWPSCVGNIITTEIKVRLEAAMYGSLIRNYPEVTYNYQVSGRQYTGSRVSPDFMNSCVYKEKVSYQEWAKWENGQEIKIYYHPKNPKYSYLIIEPTRHRKSHYWSLVLSGVMLTGVGVFLTVMALSNA